MAPKEGRRKEHRWDIIRVHNHAKGPAPRVQGHGMSNNMEEGLELKKSDKYELKYYIKQE